MFAQYALFPPSFSMNDMEPHGFTAYIPITEGTSLADAQWPVRPRREIILNSLKRQKKTVTMEEAVKIKHIVVEFKNP